MLVIFNKCGNAFGELLIAVQTENLANSNGQHGKGKTHGKSNLDISSVYNLNVKVQ